MTVMRCALRDAHSGGKVSGEHAPMQHLLILTISDRAQSYLIPAPHLALPVAALTSPLHRKLYAIRLGVSSLSEHSAATLASVRDELEGEIERLHEEVEEEVVRREEVEKERETALEAARKGEQLVEEWAQKAQAERRRRLTGSPASEYVFPLLRKTLAASNFLSATEHLHYCLPCAVMRVQLPLKVRMISPTSEDENDRRLQSAQQQQLLFAQLDRLHLPPMSPISWPISDSTHRPRRRKKRRRCGQPRLKRSRRSRRLRVAVIGERRRRRNDRGPALRGTTGARIVVVVVAPTAERRRIRVATCSLRHLPCRGLKRRPRCRHRLDPFRPRRLLAPRQGPEAQHPHRLRRVLPRALLGGRNRKFPLR